LIVVDASVLANIVGDDGNDGRRARRELRSASDVAAPDLVDVETVAVLRKRWLAGTVSPRRFARAVVDLEAVVLHRYPALPLMRRAYELRANVTPHDAAYVALAEVLQCELLTGDRRLALAPRRRTKGNDSASSAGVGGSLTTTMSWKPFWSGSDRQTTRITPTHDLLSGTCWNVETTRVAGIIWMAGMTGA
jgi:predicted nucleic acid-binding protein